MRGLLKILIVGFCWQLALLPATETLRVENYAIERKDESLVYFTFEIADTGAARNQGLMWRKNLDPRHGMLFDFEREMIIPMWMKNTLIPLDMLFVDQTGRIIDIALGATPNSLEIVNSKMPARYTLELNAGAVEYYEISAGDRLYRLPW